MRPTGFHSFGRWLIPSLDSIPFYFSRLCSLLLAVWSWEEDFWWVVLLLSRRFLLHRCQQHDGSSGEWEVLWRCGWDNNSGAIQCILCQVLIIRKSLRKMHHSSTTSLSWRTTDTPLYKHHNTEMLGHMWRQILLQELEIRPTCRSIALCESTSFLPQGWKLHWVIHYTITFSWTNEGSLLQEITVYKKRATAPPLYRQYAYLHSQKFWSE